jgi:xanthine/CO dehydrogenase XdhC/CoxF family maturation factor
MTEIAESSVPRFGILLASTQNVNMNCSRPESGNSRPNYLLVFAKFWRQLRQRPKDQWSYLMHETQQIVDLWKRARNKGETAYLATVVHVKGSSYRKPGARMLVTSGGERAGTISGGCLEAEVSRRIAWITKKSSAVLSYQSSFDDEAEDVPYGLGCGGTIWILMEGGSAAAAVLDALERAVERREASVVVSSLTDKVCGTSLILDGISLRLANPSGVENEVRPTERYEGPARRDEETSRKLLRLSRRALEEGRPISDGNRSDDGIPAFLAMPVLPPPRLTVFGAGDDAQPIVRLAAELGWHVTVADGRSHLVRQERFPQANILRTLTFHKTDSEGQLNQAYERELRGLTGVQSGDIAVILTHSYEQDKALLKALLPESLRYLGILGPLHRTKRLLAFIAPSLGISEEECLARLHAPVGLAIGSAEPSVIALAIIAEIQADLSNRTVHVAPKDSHIHGTLLFGDLPSPAVRYAP